MATELAAAYVTIIPSLRGAKSAIEKELNGVGVDDTGRKWGASLVSSVGGGFTKIAGIGIKAIAGIGSAVGGLAMGGGISRAMKLDQAEMKFENMGINVEKAMKSCNEAVIGTAYGLDAAATVASSLGASGVKAGKQMTQALKGVAGMAAMSGRSMEDIGLIFGKVAAQGKVQGDELTQFAEAGINATAALAKYMNKSQAEVRELVSDGKVDFKTFSDAMYASFGEAAQGANDTFQGAMSNVMAALSRIGAKFASPALDGLRKVFVALIPAVDAVSKALDPLVAKFTDFVEAASGGAVKAVETFTEAVGNGSSYMDALKAAIGTLPEDLQKLIGAIAGVAGAVAGGAIATKIYGIGSALVSFAPNVAAVTKQLVAFGLKMPVVSTAFGIIGSKINVLGSAMAYCGGGVKGFAGVLGSALLGPVGIAVGAIAALAAAFIYLWNTNDGFRASMTALGTQLVSAVMPLLTQLGSLLATVAQAVMQVATILLSALMPIITNIVSFVGAALPVIVAVVTGAFTVISSVVTAAMTVIQGVISAVMAVVQGDWEGAWGIITGALSSAWNTITGGVSAGIETVLAYLGDLPSKVQGFFSDAGNWLLDAGENIVHGLWDGISGAMDWLGEKLGSIGTFIAEHKGPKAYDLKLLVPNGQWVMTSLVRGIESGIPALSKALSGVSGYIADFSSEISPFGDVNARVNTFSRSEVSDDRNGISDEIYALLASYLPELANMQVVFETGVVAGEVTPYVDKNLGKKNARRSKGL